MNNEIKEKALAIHNWILQQPVVKEYQKYEKLIKENETLSNQEKRLKELQKEIVNKKYKEEDCEELINEYNELKEQFYNSPLVHNYLSLKEEVNQLFQQISQMLNQSINQ